MALGINRLFDVTSIIGKSLRMRMFWWLGSIPQGKNLGVVLLSYLPWVV